jgi:CRP/FNR family transcriptional regulator, anaerobic regulatory protein
MEKIKGLLNRYTIASANDWLQWFNISKMQKFEKGDVLISQGEVSKTCAFVLNGAFKSVAYSSGGCEKILSFGFTTDFLTSCEIYNSQIPSSFSIVTMEDSEVIL